MYASAPARLGGEPGNGFVDQLTAWVTGEVANASDDPPAVRAWMNSERQAGAAIVRWPYSDGFKGELASRDANVDASGKVLGYNYYLAPIAVINADRARRKVDAFATNVILPVAEAGDKLAHVLAAPGRMLIVAGVAYLAFQLLARRR